MEFLSGSEMIAKGAIAAGCRAFFGYPITPASEIMELMAEGLPKVGGVFRQMEDEIAASAASIGASWAGAKAMTATSGPGFSLIQENIDMATMLEIPLLVVDAQRMGPSTGIPTVGSQQDLMQAIWGRHGDQLPLVLCPSNFGELFTMTIKAFNLAEMFRTPVILLTDGHLVNLRSSVSIDQAYEVVDRKVLDAKDATAPFRTDESLVPGFPPLGKGFNVLLDTLSHDERGYPTSSTEKTERLLVRLREKIVRSIDKIWLHEQSGVNDSKEIVVSYGSSAIAVRRAVDMARSQGKKVGLLVMKTMWPLDERAMKRILNGKQRIIVVEQALGQLAWLIRPFAGESEVVSITSLGRPPRPRKVEQVILNGI
jgi:2-oxoglutarate ferredoxin oxidoreductase subunit alpha